MDVRHRHIRKTALPRTGRALDAVGGGVVSVSGGGAGTGGGSSVEIEANLDIVSGKGINVSKSQTGETLLYTISHGDTSNVESTGNADDLFIQNIELDQFGHVLSVESIRLAASLDDRYLRKDIDDTMHGNLSLDKNIGSTIFIDGWDGKGWQIPSTGDAILEALRVRSDIFLKGYLGSDAFISGFPSGYGWQVSPYERTNAAGTTETKYKLEIDDISVRGNLRVYEMIISQLRGENDNVIFAGQMKVHHYDAETGRIYLDTEEGVLYNPFRAGDILMVQRFGGMPTAENDYNVIKQYELQVADAGIGSLSDGEERLDWITFTNFVGSLSDIEERDVLTRVDSATDSTRKGVVRVTTIDEIGAPYIDVVYGLKTDLLNATKCRMGNLTGIRTKSGVDLTGVWGFYGNGAYFENSTYIMQDGNTIEQTFIAMNGKFESLIESIRNDMSSEGGNILVNSSFSQNTNYWEVSNEVYFINVEGKFLYVDDAFYVEKDQVADIYNDGGRNVLRLRETYILQRNDVMDIPERTETSEEGYTYSFSLFYNVIRPGTLKVGFTGSELYVEQQLQATEGYQKLSKSGKWDETGDFRIEFTGEIYIYGVSLFSDEMADALIRLETKIEQTDEKIALMATKEYVDSETEKVYAKYDAELKVQADLISQRVTKEEYLEGTNSLKSTLESMINVEAGRITAISSEIDHINDTINSAGWITTSEGNALWASKDLEDGDTIVSYINQTATSIKISANRINLQGAVTFSMFSNSLQNTINGKANEDDLNSKLSNYTQKGTITYNDLASALKSELDGKLTGSVSTSAGKLASVILNGQALVAGGYIQADLINADTILANAAYIGNFTIENGWLTCNSDTQGVNGYIALRSSNTHIHLGRDVMPATQGYNATLTASFSNQNRPKNYSSTDPGSCISIEASAIGNYSSYLHPVGFSCQGELHVRGSVSMVESLFYGVNANISSSNCADAHVLRYQRVFVFQPTSYVSVYLPSDTAIADAFGSQNDGCNSVDRAVIIIYILVTRYATEQINVQSTIPIVDENGNEIKQNSAVSRSNFNMGRGDSAILMYYNRNWYIINRTQ